MHIDVHQIMINILQECFDLSLQYSVNLMNVLKSIINFQIMSLYSIGLFRKK